MEGQLFNEYFIDDFFNDIRHEIANYVTSLDEVVIKNEDTHPLSIEIANRFALKPLRIDFDNPITSTEMVDVPIGSFPAGTIGNNSSYPCAKAMYQL